MALDTAAGRMAATPGEKTPGSLGQEWQNLALPSLSGRTVLDIGAWDGWFSFAAERSAHRGS